MLVANFSRELIFAFYTPPLRVLSSKFILKVVHILVNEKNMQFFRRQNKSDHQYMLKYKTMSASIVNLIFLSE